MIDAQQSPARDAEERAPLFEHLLLFDTVSIKDYGEDVAFAVMLRLSIPGSECGMCGF